MDGYWYELHAVTDFPTAKKQCKDLREADALINPKDYPNPYGDGPMVYYDSKPGDLYHCKATSKTQQAWKEVQDANVEGYLYLLWKRIPAPTAAPALEATQPAPLMVEGEGAPQYCLFAPAENTQLVLF